jgi:hypothetical protein
LGCACSGSIGGIAPNEARKSVAALEPQRARQEVLDPDLRIAVEALVPMGAGGEEVTWDDFLASLPNTLAADGSPADAAAHPGASAPPPQRRSREGSVLPRAYATPRVTRRRTGASDAVPAAAAPAPPPAAAPPVTRPAPAPRASTALTPTGPRSTQPVPRRSQLVEGGSGPRFPVHVKPALTPADRWLLIAIVFGASVLSASVTGYLTVRGIAGRPAPVSASGSVAISPPQRPLDAAAMAKDSEAVLIAHPDTAAPPLAMHPTPAPLGDQRTLAVAPPAAPLAAPLAAPPAPVAAPKPRGRPMTKPVVAKPLYRAAPTAPPVAASSPIVLQVAPAAAPMPVAPPPAPPVAHADSAAPAAVPAAAAATVAPSAAPPVDVAAELKAIREELNARKRRVDSLTKSLDSLKTASPPPP